MKSRASTRPSCVRPSRRSSRPRHRGTRSSRSRRTICCWPPASHTRFRTFRTSPRNPTHLRVQNGQINLFLSQEKERIQTVTGENEKLLEEKRELLRKVSQAEEMGNQGMRTASNLQHRYCPQGSYWCQRNVVFSGAPD